MFRYILAIWFIVLPLASYAAPTPPPSNPQEYQKWAENILHSLHPRTGKVELKGAPVTLDVPKNFIYLDPKDAETVLVDVWGNPPGSPTLGMLFPADITPFDSDSWAVTIRYQADGHVSDSDAKDINYDDMLKTMKGDVSQESEQRKKQGYSAIELVGWAEAPHYDEKNHKLYWAKDFHFGDAQQDTLNYNIRVLGRKGVLVLNFIASMEQTKDVEAQFNTVLDMASFNSGSRYSDFNPSMDKVAAYGLGALIAGKVAAKAGFFAAALILFKKVWVVIAVVVGGFFRRLLGKKKK